MGRTDEKNSPIIPESSLNRVLSPQDEENIAKARKKFLGYPYRRFLYLNENNDYEVLDGNMKCLDVLPTDLEGWDGVPVDDEYLEQWMRRNYGSVPYQYEIMERRIINQRSHFTLVFWAFIIPRRERSVNSEKIFEDFS